MTCQACTATTTNGLALCDRCQITASVIFEFLPVYFRNLARWRPGRSGRRDVPGPREPQRLGGGAAGDPASRALDEAGTAITGWAKCLADDRGVELPESEDETAYVAALCRLFSEHLTSIATLEWAGEFLRDMGIHEQRLRGLTERIAPGWYAGECKQCHNPTHVIPGLTWVTCGYCGATTYARDHLETIMDEARGWVARPIRMAEAVVALVDSELSVPKVYTRIRQWAHQGDLTPHRHTKRDHVWDNEAKALVVAEVETGYARYRFGDVLDRVLLPDTTRNVNTRAS